MRRSDHLSWLWITLSVFAPAACGDADRIIDLPPPTDHDESPVIPGTDRVASCDEAPTGAPCGESGRVMHCIYDACVKNACGDGIKAGREECDDGDEVDGNGCSQRCTLEVCGNGIVDFGEECDDGNMDASDRCNGCRKQEPPKAMDAGTGETSGGGTVCPMPASLVAEPSATQLGGMIALDGPLSDGAVYVWTLNGKSFSATSKAVLTCSVAGELVVKRLVTKPGCLPVLEETTVTCVDGDAAIDAGSDAGAGNPAPTMDAGSGLDADAESGALTPDAGQDGSDTEAGRGGNWSAECQSCVRSACADYNTLLLSGPCFSNDGNGLLGALPQPATTEACVAAVGCSLAARSGCADDVVGPARCYCGEQTIDACLATGPLVNAECVPEWERATSCPAGDFTCVTGAFQDLSRAAGYAFFTIECANALCAAQCGLTPPQP